MTDPTPTDWRALCAELLKAWEIELGDLHQTNRLCKRARTALAQPEPQMETVAWCSSDDFNDAAKKRQSFSGWREQHPDCDLALCVFPVTAQPEPQGATDKELLELMPETMRDEFSYAANVCSDAIGGRVKPGIFRVALNTAALEYAHAVLARWGTPAIEPQGPTDEELKQLLFNDYRGVIEFVCDVEEEAHVMAGSHVQFARAVLTRWGRPAIEPVPADELLAAYRAGAADAAIKPVPVAERLPGLKDCDGEGKCWFWADQLGDYDDDWGWKLLDRTYGPSWGASHWLPHHALLVPQEEGNHG
jgi:hypothetical protein